MIFQFFIIQFRFSSRANPHLVHVRRSCWRRSEKRRTHRPTQSPRPCLKRKLGPRVLRNWGVLVTNKQRLRVAEPDAARHVEKRGFVSDLSLLRHSSVTEALHSRCRSWQRLQSSGPAANPVPAANSVSVLKYVFENAEKRFSTGHRSSKPESNSLRRMYGEAVGDFEGTGCLRHESLWFCCSR
jgi:hypothetical protein